MFVDRDVLSGHRLTRNRFLALAGSTITAFAAGVWFPREAEACEIPYGCHGYCQCSACSGSVCTRPDCKRGYFGCESGAECWYTCSYTGSSLYSFKCCDYAFNAGNCICRAYIGTC